MSESVIQSWVNELTFKQQTVLLSSLRGCDGIYKEDLSKPLIRALRAVILKNAEMRSSVFMNGSIDETTVNKFAEDFDQYCLHFVMHLIHAVEIIGYKHPEHSVRLQFCKAYYRLAEALHLLPETPHHLEIRLADKPYTDKEKEKYNNIFYNYRPLPATFISKDDSIKLDVGFADTSQGNTKKPRVAPYRGYSD